MTIDLYTPADVSKVRNILIKEQDRKCAIIGDFPKDRTFVLDHAHDDEQYVRAALERETNAFLGIIENAYKRHLSYWLPMHLPDVLNRIAAYLERSSCTPDTRWRHNGWIKKIQTKFNTLKSSQQDELLVALGQQKGKNLVERKKLFLKAIKTKQFSYATIRSMINNLKGTNK
jgi:hypothetical protein